jgi:hypothetical protein
MSNESAEKEVNTAWRFQVRNKCNRERVNKEFKSKYFKEKRCSKGVMQCLRTFFCLLFRFPVLASLLSLLASKLLSPLASLPSALSRV